MAEIIVALDLPAMEARRLLDRVPEARWVKVGAILFAEDGPGLVRELLARGLSVFLDLKWHDIPHTVAGAVSRARDLGVAMATVHACGGREMLEAARDAAGEAVGIVAVTVLTSHSPESYAAATGRTTVDVGAEVERLAALAFGSGLRGVVCSPLEVATVRAGATPGGWIVVPGIRRSGDPAGDQARTAAPRAAASAGATHLVVGRPILTAGDPRSVFLEMAREGS